MYYTFEVKPDCSYYTAKVNNLKNKLLNGISEDLKQDLKEYIKIAEKSLCSIEVQAKDEDDAFEKLAQSDDLIESIMDNIEIVECDDRDEAEIKERARANYEAYLEDQAMERYYESKYGEV